MEPIIEIKNLSKKYNIRHNQGGYIALRDVLTNIAKSPFQFFKHKAKQVIGRETKEEFWALKDLNLEIAKGEVLGIIGPNGAGKSTLLKILSQITPPTTGEIKIHGKVGSLLEVGTGFHPELTGRENILLNGAILGMARKEIAQKFDQIVEFAGIEKFLDTPVKYYSSGMYVRLAFSVAAHLEPDILIIDEVLAVGDAEFQKKCLGKMDEITKKDGRTIIFVSHNMAAIKSLCSKCVLLKGGKIDAIGETGEIVDKYFKDQIQPESAPIALRPRIGSKITLRAKLMEITVSQTSAVNNFNFKNNDPLDIKLTVETQSGDLEMSIQLVISDEFQNISLIDSAAMHNKFFELKKGVNEITCRINALNLFSGSYKLSCYLIIPGREIIDYVKDAYAFNIVEFDPYGTGSNIKKDQGMGFMHIDHRWID